MKLDPLFTRTPTPSTAEMQSRLDKMWERLQSEIENTATERVSISVSIRPYWVFGKALWVVAGIVLAAILVSGLVWRNGSPFSIAFKTSSADERSMSKSSRQRGAETLPVIATGDAFEVASVKLVPSSSEAFKVASMGETSQVVWLGCAGGYAITSQVNPGRLTIPGASVSTLIMLAYGLGRDCTLVDGGPAWARSGEYYEIQASLPKDTPAETLGALLKGEAPRLQRMLQTLLADRFHLVLKRELRETPVYALTVASPGKMKLSPEERLPFRANLPELPGMPPLTVGRGQLLSAPGAQIMGHAVSMPDLAKFLRQFAGRIVVDKTGWSDLFDVDLKFSPNTAPPTTATPPVSPQSIPPLQGVSLQDALEEQLGLKLEATRMPIEVLVIESVERPSAN
jgi:uncharacterized protein (TIGR03435 family)